jgi:hypothetical protein
VICAQVASAWSTGCATTMGSPLSSFSASGKKQNTTPRSERLVFEKRGRAHQQLLEEKEDGEFVLAIVAYEPSRSLRLDSRLCLRGINPRRRGAS